MFEDFGSHLILGLQVALSWSNLWYCFLGVTLGMIFGIIPGIGTLAAISMIFPITFYLDPVSALIMLAGVYYGTDYGGKTASILLNLPGTPSNAVVCIDGYPLARRGRAGVALLVSTVASFFGACFGIILVMFFSPVIVQVAFQFGPAEYFALMAMGLIAATTMSSGSQVKGIAMVVLGILIGLVGTDIYAGTTRFTFGHLELADGVSIVAVAMGIFGVSEVIASVRNIQTGDIHKGISLRTMWPTWEEARVAVKPMFRGSLVGSFFGTLPGTGGTISAFVAYAVERKVAKDPSRFGNGAIEGIAGPEAANNAADQTSFIPTLTLGIPGTASMALMLGILIIHGIAPGPTLMTDRPDLFWGVIMSFWVGNLILLILNIPLIGLFIRIIMVPYHLMFPAVMMFVAVGVMSIQNEPFDVLVVMTMGALGYAMRLLSFPAAPLLLGYVLGPMMEEHFRRAMIISRGSADIFFARPISLTFLLIALAMLAWGIYAHFRGRSAVKVVQEEPQA